MAAASAAPRVNRRIPSRSGFGGVTAVTVPSAATWQVTPAGQVPSRTAAAARAAAGVQDAAQPRRAGLARWRRSAWRPALPRRGRAAGRRRSPRSAPRGPGQGELEASSSPRAASSVAGTARPGIAAGRRRAAAGRRRRREMIAAGSPVRGGRGLGEQGGEDRAGGGGAPGPVRPRPPRAAMSTAASLRRRGCRAGSCRAAARAGRGAPAPAAALSGSLPGAAVLSPSRPARGRASYRSRYGSAAGASGVRPASSSGGPGGGGRAARRRALMTSGSGGVSGCRVLGGPGRGR